MATIFVARGPGEGVSAANQVATRGKDGVVELQPFHFQRRNKDSSSKGRCPEGISTAMRNQAKGKKRKI
ncbi:hypothetical protein HJFPF1_06698 [Paramyrothecium foliicola]|nr:hypothetical protein HJFPF1_06698 [Paramyrothecium foliicola]